MMLAAREFEEAQKQADLAQQLNPEYAETYALKSAIAFRRGNSLRAIELAQRALSKDPANDSAVAVLTEVYKTDRPNTGV